MELFDGMGLSPEVLKALDKMGFRGATPVQEKAIQPMLAGGDLTVQAPTGTGKTCAFGIPIVEKTDTRATSVQTLILSPTRELAIQTAAVLRDLTRFKPGVRVVCVYGGERIEKQMLALRKRPQIIVATPGRLLDHIQRRTIRLQDVNRVVLDEADRMLDMGFRPDLNKILSDVPEDRQTVLFSATLSKDIMLIANTYQKDSQMLKVEQKTLTVDSVKQFYTEIRGRSKNAELSSLLQRERYALSLVFVNTKRMAERLALELEKDGFRAASLHGDMRQHQRDKVMNQYRRGHLDVLVATDVAARGIDVNNIDAVINYDIPQDCDSYVHRIGRTGRAHQNGVAYTFIYPAERDQLRHVMFSTKAVILPTDTDAVALSAKNSGASSLNFAPRKSSGGYKGGGYKGGSSSYKGSDKSRTKRQRTYPPKDKTELYSQGA